MHPKFMWPSGCKSNHQSSHPGKGVGIVKEPDELLGQSLTCYELIDRINGAPFL
jgi:hypothetical protein